MGITVIDNGIKEYSSSTLLKDILDKYADEIITDDQLARILDPILKLIKEGRFDRPVSKFKSILRKLLVS